MQYLKMDKDLTLSQLSGIVGERNVDTVLNANSLDRAVNIGKEFYDRINAIPDETAVDYQKKLNVLNQFVGDSDLYEKTALGTERDWNALAQFNCFTDAIKIPIEVKLPPSTGVLGNGEPVSDDIYRKCTEYLIEGEHIIPSSVFSEYNTSYAGTFVGVTDQGIAFLGEPFQWFNLPWGEIALYSSISDELVYFPVYPEGFDDGRSANFEEMPEMLYQYEPWQVYKSSGPREVTLTFNFHRDMWTGDHRDGNANDLIRACQANCYPEFDGSLVNVPIVTIYLHGRNFITGVMTNCTPAWDKPIGLDGYYLVCKLSLTIKEVSPEPLDYHTVRNKGIIG